MKKINTYFNKNYLPVKIYLDDLEKIIEVLKEAQGSITLKTNEYEYESLEELVNHVKSENVAELNIESRRPYVTIEFKRMWASISVTGDSQSAGIFYSLDKIISNRTRYLMWLYSYYLFIFTGIWSIIQYYLSLKKVISGITIFIVQILIILWVLWFLYVRLRRHSIIYLVHKNAEKPFIRRNKDTLIIAIISALIGTALGVVGTLLVNYLQSK